MKPLMIIVLVTALAAGAAAALHIALPKQPAQTPVPPIAWPDDSLQQVEYSVYGGMENQSITYTLRWEDNRYTPTLTVNRMQNGEERAYTYSPAWNTMDDFEAFIAAYSPEGWADLPQSELQALDAPVSRVTLTYADGTEYTVTDDKEVDGALFRNTLCFLESYTVASQPYELTLSIPAAGEPEYELHFSAPEKVWYTAYKQQDAQGGHQEILRIYGRIPGDVLLIIDGPEGGPIQCMLRVDAGYNVSRLDQNEP